MFSALLDIWLRSHLPITENLSLTLAFETMTRILTDQIYFVYDQLVTSVSVLRLLGLLGINTMEKENVEERYFEKEDYITF